MCKWNLYVVSSIVSAMALAVHWGRDCFLFNTGSAQCQLILGSLHGGKRGHVAPRDVTQEFPCSGRTTKSKRNPVNSEARYSLDSWYQVSRWSISVSRCFATHDILNWSVGVKSGCWIPSFKKLESSKHSSKTERILPLSKSHLTLLAMTISKTGRFQSACSVIPSGPDALFRCSFLRLASSLLSVMQSSRGLSVPSSRR